MLRSTTRLFRLPVFPIIAVAMALFGPMLLQRKALFWGTPILQFVPWWSFAWQTVLRGQLPLWNPMLGMGAPLVANYQSALFYPPNWTYLLLFAIGGSPLLAWGQALLVSMHLVWSGIGMVALVRRLGLGVLAQSIAGLSFAYCGYLVARAGFLSINAAVSWLPWILLLLTPRVLNERIPLRQYLLFSICLALQLLSGHAQTVWYTLILAGLWVGFWAWEGGGKSVVNTPRQLIRMRFLMLGRSWGWLLVGLMFAVLLAAVQLFPTVEYLLQSQRAQAVEYERAMTYSFWPWRLVDLFAPGFFGHPAVGDYWGYGNYWEDAIYIGLLPILLALGALLGNIKRFDKDANPEDNELEATPLLVSRHHLIWFLFILILITLVLSLGQNTPVFPWLYDHVPTFDLFQAPTRMMIWVEFALVLLAALGAESWRRPEGRGLYWTRLGTAGAFAIAFGAGAAWYFMGDISPSFIRATVFTGIWGLLAGIMSLIAPPRDFDMSTQETSYHLGAWHWGVAIIVAINLFVDGRGANPSIDMDMYEPSQTGVAIRESVGSQRLYLSREDEEYLKFERFFRFDTFQPSEDWLNLREIMLPNMMILENVQSANNFDPMLSGRYARWMVNLDSTTHQTQASLLRLMNVGIIERPDDVETYGVRFDPINGGVRLRWFPCAVVVTDQEVAWNSVMSGDVDINTTLIVESTIARKFDDDPTIVRSSDDCPTEFPLQVQLQIKKETPIYLEIQHQATKDGWFLISDTWYPGWHAWVDDEHVSIHPADYLFKAIRVSKGTHRIVLRYQPFSFWFGVALSVSAWLVLILIWRRIR